MADLYVSSKRISFLLGSQDMQNKRFLIPEYQRPYQWDTEKCDVLWSDIVDFHTSTSSKNEGYFLGTIVVCKNEDGDYEVIDGQQRLTSLLLLLRAFYYVLDRSNVENNKVITLKNKIAPCIWDVDPLTSEVPNYKDIRLKTLVATEGDNEILHSILADGLIEDDLIKSRYKDNFSYFLNRCQDYAKNNPMDWYALCLRILDGCILLPIESNSLESALTIFSTLNDRGLPLSDADIFKAQLYRSKKTEVEKSVFIEQWKELTSMAADGGFSVDDVFRYYSHVLRAKSEDVSKEIALRRFYTENRAEKLLQEQLFEGVCKLANFWKNISDAILNKKGSCSLISGESIKWLHCLSFYPNEFWKYAVSVYSVRYFDDKSFQVKFSCFLKKLAAFLYAKFIITPSVTEIKNDIYKACRDIYFGENLVLKQEIPDSSFYDRHDSGRLTKGLLVMNAYLYDEGQNLLPVGVEIEHIFPKKWQNTNYNGWDKEEADVYLESIGNKIILEKKLNIQAGNGYFSRKKGNYSKSGIFEVNGLANKGQEDWLKEDIEVRKKEIIDRINSFFQNYVAL